MGEKKSASILAWGKVHFLFLKSRNKEIKQQWAVCRGMASTLFGGCIFPIIYPAVNVYISFVIRKTRKKTQAVNGLPAGGLCILKLFQWQMSCCVVF